MGVCPTKTHPNSADKSNNQRNQSLTSTLTYTSSDSASTSQDSRPEITEEQQPPHPPVSTLSRVSEEHGSIVEFTGNLSRKSSEEYSLSEMSTVASLDPSIEVLRLIRESLSYASGDHNTFFIMGASVCIRFSYKIYSLLFHLQGDLAKKKIYPTLW